jgi:hypothetical protein
MTHRDGTDPVLSNALLHDFRRQKETLTTSRNLLGLLIIAIRLWLARAAARAILAGVRHQSHILDLTAQAAILLLFGATELR